MKIKLDHQNIWFISDTHFGHKNIIEYSNRPFKTVREHDDTLIRNWNWRVMPTDIVFHLGDFLFGAYEDIPKTIKRLNGNIIFVRGNHDKVLEKYYSSKHLDLFDYIDLSVDDSDANRGVQDICLFHYPIEEWNKCHHGSWHLYGHTHGNSKFDKNYEYKRWNVGDDVNQFNPISYWEVKTLLKSKKIKSHH